MKVWFLLPLAFAIQGISGRHALAGDPDLLVQEGIDLRRSHPDEEALILFQRAYNLKETPRLLALAEQAIGRWGAADRHLRQALLSEDDPWIRRNHVLLRDAVKVIAGHVGHLAVSGSPAGAAIRVDGDLVGHLPLSLPISVAAGHVAVEVSASGHLSIVRAAVIAAGQLTRESVALQPLADLKGESASVATVAEHLAWERNVTSFQDPGCAVQLIQRGGMTCNQLHEDGQSAKALAFVGYGFAAAFVAAAANTHFTGPRSQSRPKTGACTATPLAPAVGCAFRF